MEHRKPAFEESNIDTQPEPMGVPEPISDLETLGTLRTTIQRLKSLQLASANLLATLDWNSVLEKSVDSAARLADADRASLMLLDEHSNTLLIARAYNLPEDVVATTRVKLGEGVVGWVAQNRQPLLLHGPIDRVRYPNAVPKSHLIGSSICVPLVVRDGTHPPYVTGVLNVSRSIGVPALTQEDLDLVYQFGGVTALALRNAREFQMVQRRAQQASHMIAVSQRLAEKFDAHDALAAIVEHAVALLHAQTGALFRIDAKTNELVCQLVVGRDEPERFEQRIPPGIGIVGHCARIGKPVIVNDVKADARFYAQIDNLALPNTQATLCVPLIRQGRVIGVLQIVNKVDGTWFENSDLELVHTFAVQSAVALGNAQLYSDLRHSFADTVRAINNAIEARDGITSSHTNRVTSIALILAEELHWNPEKIQHLEIGSLLHDIGKIGMPDRLLFKEGIFTEDEYLEFKNHPLVGARMLSGVAALEPVLPYVLYHQERYDGKGYPFGLAGDAIPLEGRLLSVADTFDAMTSHRPYRAGLSEEQAIAEITRQRGTQFDPVIVDALVAAYQKGKLKGIAQTSPTPLPVQDQAASVPES